MLFIYKRSSTPISPWGVLRHGGANNLSEQIKGKYLVLLSAEIVQRDGAWHYIFAFDVRDTLEKSALAQLAGGRSAYPNDMDWSRWLGGQWEIINESVREEILKVSADETHTDAKITDMREVANGRPIPGRKPGELPYEAPPDDFILALPGT